MNYTSLEIEEILNFGLKALNYKFFNIRKHSLDMLSHHLGHSSMDRRTALQRGSLHSHFYVVNFNFKDTSTEFFIIPEHIVVNEEIRRRIQRDEYLYDHSGCSPSMSMDNCTTFIDCKVGNEYVSAHYFNVIESKAAQILNKKEIALENYRNFSKMKDSLSQLKEEKEPSLIDYIKNYNKVKQ